MDWHKLLRLTPQPTEQMEPEHYRFFDDLVAYGDSAPAEGRTIGDVVHIRPLWPVADEEDYQ